MITESAFPRTPTVNTMNEILCSKNPADDQLVGEVEITHVNAIPGMIEIARSAQIEWRRSSIEERAALVSGAAEPLSREAERLGTLISKEMGKPIDRAIGEAVYCAGELPRIAQAVAAALQPQEMEGRRARSTLYFDPLGVCAAITPWNYPVSMPQSLVIPALVAGNSVILKPSEETPLSGGAYASLLNEVLPPGVLQVVQGADTQGRGLVEAPIDLIAFTGSRAVGKQIMAAAAKRLTRVILELGGKDPMIVLDDADIEKAASFAVENSFENAGQMCVSTERIYVDEKVADAFESRVAEIARSVVLGSGSVGDAYVGPMVNARQRAHVLGQIDRALQAGARMLAGKQDVPEGYVAPTVLVNVDTEMDIMREETFGPVACIQRFTTVDEAVAQANDNPYGLGAAVFGQDEARAFNVARRLESGMIGINKGCFGVTGTPWVGAKQSGYGYHGSADGYRQFAQVRVITQPK